MVVRRLQAFAVAAFSLAVLGPHLQVHAQEAGAPQDDPPASEATSVEGIVVTSARAAVETSIDRRSYSVGADLSAETGSVADVLRNIPSVQIDAQGNPSLLGQGNVTVLIDGRPSSQLGGPSLGQALQAMAADRIDRVEVMTNPPAEYRVDGAGGIINLITKKARGAGRTGSVRIGAGSFDRASAAMNLGYNSDNLSFTGAVAVRRVPQSVFSSQTLSRIDRNGRDVGGSRWTNDHAQAHAALDYDLDGRTRITGSVWYSASRYDTLYADRFVETDALGAVASALDRTGEEDEFLRRGEAALTWRRTLGERHALTLHADQKTYDNRYRRTDLMTPVLPAGSARSGQRVAWNDSSPRTTLTADYERPAAGGRLKLGYDYEYAPKRTDQDTRPLGGPLVLYPSQRGVFFDTETNSEAYASYERALGRLTVLGGLRFKHLRLELEQRTLALDVTHDYARLYPNLRFAYALGEGRRLTASFSRRTNVPYSEQLDPLPLSQSPLLLEAGSPDLRPEDAYSYELSYEDRADGPFMLGTLFYRETRDAFSTLATVLPNAVVLQTTVNAGSIRRAGGEWAVGGKLTPRLSYNLSLAGYWIEIAAANLGLSEPRSSVTGFGRASLNWQITPKDLLQLNLVTTGKVLRPQGHSDPTYSGSIGYRHTVNSKVSWMLVVDDPFRTLEHRSVERVNGAQVHRLQRPPGRSISLALVWSFAGRPKEESFEFGSGDARR